MGRDQHTHHHHHHHVADEHLIAQSQSVTGEDPEILQVGKASRAQALVKRAREPQSVLA